jgi:hypothetical protein
LENADLYSPDGGQIPIFLKKGGAHRCVLGAKIKPGNGDFDDTPPALHPPFYGAAGGERITARFFSFSFLTSLVLLRVMLHQTTCDFSAPPIAAALGLGSQEGDK